MALLARAKLDRLTARLAVGITILLMVPLAAGLLMLSRYHFDQTIAARRAAAELENRILEAALRHQMITRDSRLMTEILEEIAHQPEVRRAMVLDHEGVIRLSSRREDVGARIPRRSPTCMVCHEKAREKRQNWVVLKDEDLDVLRSVQPIANRPECHRCHGSGKAFNGMLLLDISLAPIHEQLRRDATRMAAGTTILTFILLGGVGLLVRHLVLVRLARLGRTARTIAGGALTERARVEGDDVISALAADFNNMADATSRLIATVRDREQQMAGVLNSLDDGLIVLDRHLRVVAANRSIARRLGAEADSLRGRNCRTAIAHGMPCRVGADCPAARCLAARTLQQGIYRLIDTNGDRERVHEVYASPVCGPDGSLAQVVEVWRDITERVHEEERLAEIERLSSLGVLASGLSHEVNTPLASTLTCADSILGRLDDAPGTDAEIFDAIREHADTIRREVMRCRDITGRFLRFARGIPPSVEVIELPQLVDSVMVLARPTAREAGILLELESGEDVPLVTANTEVVQHVVLNVLVNAIESFDGEGGSIRARFVVGPDVRLQIRDTGCGIPPDVREHLFEPFRTRKPHGTGLGLFLARTFMRRFAGDVRLVDSTVGKGSCVEIIFPRSEPSTP